MDDLDRTFARLKKLDYNTLVSKISTGPVVNPVTFEMEYTRWAEPICIAHGWTLDELNKELKKQYEPK
jgi:hypothetical protein